MFSCNTFLRRKLTQYKRNHPQANQVRPIPHVRSVIPLKYIQTKTDEHI